MKYEQRIKLFTATVGVMANSFKQAVEEDSTGYKDSDVIDWIYMFANGARDPQLSATSLRIAAKELGLTEELKEFATKGLESNEHE